jgi:hypothetical protein
LQQIVGISVGSPNNLLAIGAEKSAAVIASERGEPRDFFLGREHDPPPPSCFES